MTRQGPLVSIITPAYNVERYLEQTIQSVLRQTYINWEMILAVDSKSKDNTLSIARNWASKDPRIQCLYSSESPGGVSQNRNVAVSVARGHYIAFLDADDLWHPEKLAIQITEMTIKSQSISYHTFSPMNERGTPIPPPRRALHKVTSDDILKNNVLSCLTVMVEASLAKNILFEEMEHEDLHYWVRLLRNRYAYPIDQDLAWYRIRLDSRSGNKFKSAWNRWLLLRRLKLSILRSIVYMSFYISSALKKRL